MAIDPAWIALIGTVCGGVGLKVAEHWLGRNKVKTDEAAQIRDELRLEITALREEVKQLEADADKWKKEYFGMYEKYINQASDLKIALEKIKNEAQQAQVKVEDVP